MAKKDTGRFSSKNKTNIVLDYIKGSSLDELSRRHKIPVSKINEWHQGFILAGQNGLRSKGVDHRDE